MPRFFFNVRDGKGFPDAEGVEFADASAACGEAVTLAGEILRDVNGKISEGGDWRLDVSDAAGNRVCSLRFSVTRP
ncbi:MAG: DUF6894 family protein [Microvirga sp.]